MSLTGEFNDSDYSTRKINSFVLGVSYSTGGGSTSYYTYDFIARILTVRTGSSDGGTSVVPFSHLDRDALITLRDKLVSLGGRPPELPPEAPATQAAQKKLNL